MTYLIEPIDVIYTNNATALVSIVSFSSGTRERKGLQRGDWCKVASQGWRMEMIKTARTVLDEGDIKTTAAAGNINNEGIHRLPLSGDTDDGY